MRAAFGLAVGFGAAAVTFLVVDRYGTDNDDRTTLVVHDELDYDGFCASVRDGGRPIRVADDEEGLRCGGFLNGVWSPIIIDYASLCTWQFGDAAEPQPGDQESPFTMVCIVPS